MLPEGNTPEALNEQIFSDSLATQNSNSRPGSTSGRLGPGQASCLPWASFLLYSMSGRGRALNFTTAPLALKISIPETWESLPPKGRPWSPQRGSPEGRGEGLGRTKSSVRTGFALTPTAPASPKRPSALSAVAPRVLEEKTKA